MIFGKVEEILKELKIIGLAQNHKFWVNDQKHVRGNRRNRDFSGKLFIFGIWPPEESWNDAPDFSIFLAKYAWQTDRRCRTTKMRVIPLRIIKRPILYKQEEMLRRRQLHHGLYTGWQSCRKLSLLIGKLARDQWVNDGLQVVTTIKVLKPPPIQPSNNSEPDFIIICNTRNRNQSCVA